MLKSIAIRDNSSPIPDLFSFTSSFWGILNLGEEQIEQSRDLIRQGHGEEEEIIKNLRRWEQMSLHSRTIFQQQTSDTLKWIAREWPQTNRFNSPKPKILLRNFKFRPVLL